MPKIFLILILCISLTACSTWRITDTDRSFIEQVLLTDATQKAVDQFRLSSLEGKKVFLDETYLESYDEEFVASSVREQIGKNGGLIVDSKESADWVVEIRVGALATNHNNFIIGFPSIDIPVPTAGTIKTPELAIYKQVKQLGLSKIYLYAYDAKNGKQTIGDLSAFGKSHYNHYIVLLIPFKKSNVVELKN